MSSKAQLKAYISALKKENIELINECKKLKVKTDLENFHFLYMPKEIKPNFISRLKAVIKKLINF